MGGDFQIVGARNPAGPDGRLLRRKEGVRVDGYDRRPRLDARERGFHSPASPAQIMAVQGVAEGIIRIGVELPADQFFSLVPLIGRGPAGKERVRIGLELGERVPVETAVGNERLGAGALESSDATIEVLCLPEGRVGLQGHPLRFHGRGQVRRHARCRGDEQAATKHFGLGNGPFDGLETADGTAHKKIYFLNSQRLTYNNRGRHHIPDRHFREIQEPGFPRLRIHLRRACGAVGRTQHIDTGDETLLRVDSLARPDHLRPPVLRIAVRRQGVANPDHRPLTVPLLLGGMIDDPGRGKDSPGLEFQSGYQFILKHLQRYRGRLSGRR